MDDRAIEEALKIAKERMQKSDEEYDGAGKTGCTEWNVEKFLH